MKNKFYIENKSSSFFYIEYNLVIILYRKSPLRGLVVLDHLSLFNKFATEK